MESLQQLLQQELMKEDGLFRDYINDPTRAKLIIWSPKYTTTSSAEKPIHSSTPSGSLSTTATPESRPTVGQESTTMTKTNPITTLAGTYFIHPTDKSVQRYVT